MPWKSGIRLAAGNPPSMARQVSPDRRQTSIGRHAAAVKPAVLLLPLLCSTLLTVAVLVAAAEPPYATKGGSLERTQPRAAVALRRLQARAQPGSVALCVVVKDQHLDVCEWLHYHHQVVGITMFYIYDNGSNPPMKETIEGCFDSTLYRYVFFGMKATRQDPPQMKAYQACIYKHRTAHQWMGFIDMDEFIVIKQPGMSNITAFLHQYREYPALAVNWLLFGSSGHETRPEGGVLANYNRTVPPDANDNRQVKIDPTIYPVKRASHHQTQNMKEGESLVAPAQQQAGTDISAQADADQEPSSVQDSQGSPSAQDSRGSPSVQDSQGSPSAQDSQGSPSVQDSQESPSAQDSQGSPSIQDNHDSPSVQDNQDRLSVRDNHDSPSVRDNQVSSSTQHSQEPPSVQDDKELVTVEEEEGSPSMQSDEASGPGQDDEQHTQEDQDDVSIWEDLDFSVDDSTDEATSTSSPDEEVREEETGEEAPEEEAGEEAPEEETGEEALKKELGQTDREGGEE